MNIQNTTEVPAWLDTSTENRDLEDPPLISANDNVNGHHHNESTTNFENTSSLIQQPKNSNNSNANNAVSSSEITKGQKYSMILSYVSCLVTLSLVVSWIHKLKGLSWESGEANEVFNWHPLMMISAFDFMTVAALSFRVAQSSSIDRYWAKLIHATSWSITIVLGTVGIIAVVKSHNDGRSGYIANLYSLHSWLGLAVMSLYVLQFIAGTAFFGFQMGSSSLRASMLQLHQFFGPFIYNMTAFTIVTGILEKETFFGCAYEVQSKDLWPADHFYDIPIECRISHFLGLVVVVMAISTSYALFQFPNKTRYNDEKVQ